MAKSKLLAALDTHKGRNIKLEKQRKLEKEAAKRKKSKAPLSELEEKENLVIPTNGEKRPIESESEVWKSDESEAAEATIIDASRLIDSDSDSDSDISSRLGEDEEPTAEKGEDEEESNEEDEGIPFSDIESLASEDKADILPHQRLTINNTTALIKAYKSITLPYSNIPFSAHQSITTAEPVAISDVHDDLTRELAFYKQCLNAANEGRDSLKREGVPFTWPNDYFAEMVKSDEHMGKIKAKMTDDAANKKAAADARKQRDLKKFGKQVQVAKLQERDKAKRDTLDKINLLKRKRKNTDTSATHEEDLFDVALEDAAKDDRPSKSTKTGPARKDSRGKKQNKDERFGYGGKKRFSKSTDAASTGDMRSFSAKRMKGKKGPQRPGKSKRAKM